MTIIDNYPNAERTVTTIEASMITPREYYRLKEISKAIRTHIENELQSNANTDGFTRNYIELAIRSSEHKNLSNTEIEIIIANAILPDDIIIAEMLSKHHFTIEHLKTIIRFRSLLKNIVLNGNAFNTELKRQFEIYKKFVTKIIEIFKSELGIDDQTIILNRISEMLVTCPSFFEERTSTSIRKK